jgi:large subunit ribosomal protein L6
MSRIGKLPVVIPAGVKVEARGDLFKAAGPRGALELRIRPEIKAEIKESQVHVLRQGDDRVSKSLHGLTRTLISNMVKGVSEGFQKRLDIVGVGYRAEVQGSVVSMTLGYSHPVKYSLPPGVTASVEKQTSITLTGPDKQVVGQVAADIRAMRPPEPYKGKGIKYADEVIRRKAGKAGKAAAGGK